VLIAHSASLDIGFIDIATHQLLTIATGELTIVITPEMMVLGYSEETTRR
jgi:hypothetical protein